jgi:hypothetical protein
MPHSTLRRIANSIPAGRKVAVRCCRGVQASTRRRGPRPGNRLATGRIRRTRGLRHRGRLGARQVHGAQRKAPRCYGGRGRSDRTGGRGRSGGGSRLRCRPRNAGRQVTRIRGAEARLELVLQPSATRGVLSCWLPIHAVVARSVLVVSTVYASNLDRAFERRQRCQVDRSKLPQKPRRPAVAVGMLALTAMFGSEVLPRWHAFLDGVAGWREMRRLEVQIRPWL